MSKVPKRRHILVKICNGFTPSTRKQQIVRVLSSKGNNLYEVETPRKEKFLASMHIKFRRVIWLERGDLVVVEPIDEGGKVKAIIVGILNNEHMKYFKEDIVWPKKFNEGNFWDI